MQLGSSKPVEMKATCPSPPAHTCFSPTPPPQVCCLPRSPWSTSSRALLPRAPAAAPAAAAAALIAHQVLPHPGAPPVQSPPPAGPSEGRTQLPTLHSPTGGKQVDAQNLPHLTEPASDTIWPDVESLDVSPCFGSIQVLLYSGDRERLEGQDRAALSNQGLSWRTGRGSWAASFLRASQATSHPGHSVSTIWKPTQGWRPSMSLPL